MIVLTLFPTILVSISTLLGIVKLLGFYIFWDLFDSVDGQCFRFCFSKFMGAVMSACEEDDFRVDTDMVIVYWGFALETLLRVVTLVGQGVNYLIIVLVPWPTFWVMGKLVPRRKGSFFFLPKFLVIFSFLYIPSIVPVFQISQT